MGAKCCCTVDKRWADSLPTRLATRFNRTQPFGRSERNRRPRPGLRPLLASVLWLRRLGLASCFRVHLTHCCHAALRLGDCMQPHFTPACLIRRALLPSRVVRAISGKHRSSLSCSGNSALFRLDTSILRTGTVRNFVYAVVIVVIGCGRRCGRGSARSGCSR